MRVIHLEEPSVEFGTGEASTTKEGLATFGPYSLRLGAAHPAAVRVGIVGTPESVSLTQDFLTRCKSPIAATREKVIQGPAFPGFDATMHSALALDKHWNQEIESHRLESALSMSPTRAFRECLAMWSEGIQQLSQRDVRLDVIVCALPSEVLEKCARIDQSRSRPNHRRHKGIRRPSLSRQQLQFDLFDSGRGSIEDASQPRPEDLVSRNFRRALKACAMDAKLPIQIATPALYVEGVRRQQDAATRAWNLSVGLFYKAGGIPWRVRPLVDHTCFVGISFHHLRTADRHLVFSSLAQAFSSDGDGFALRGDALPWDEERKRPHLGSTQAFDLLHKVLSAYRDRLGRDPLRVVIHKSSEFTSEENEGIDRSLHEIPAVEKQTLRSTEFRLVRQGTYPPHRGTFCEFGDARFLFTTGYSPMRQTYDGPHIPAPLELIGLGDEAEAERAASEILALTKMNWNSADDHVAFPISLAFARRVGLVMSEIPQGQDPHPLYRFYM